MSTSADHRTASEPRQPVILVDGVSKSFGSLKAVDEVTITIEQGTCYALLGPNGAGKTTLTRIIGGVLPRDAGEVRVLGMDPWVEQSEVKAHLGVVLQEDALDEDLDVQRNLEIYGRFFWLKGKKLRERVRELLEMVSLNGREKSSIMALSGGMKRRLVIARALLNDPDILSLDEPTTGLDPQVRQLIWTLMRQLKAEDMTILLTTHYMTEAEQLADRVGIMDRGKLIAEGTPKDLVRANLPPYVLELDARESNASLREMADGALTEEYGDRFYVFHDEEHHLGELIARFRLSTATLRSTTLEDVFLKLTGRGLHD